MTAATPELDPRWDWIETTSFADPGPQYIQGRCRHLDVIPVVTVTDETIAHLCTTCDMQLPAEWQASMTAELVAANDIQDGARGKLVDMAETVTLFSSSLLSKWGFNDGDWPDDVWDILDERGATDLVDHWHDVLIELVKTRLIPALDQQVVVVEMQTNHNPIRVTTVDGVDVQADWYEDRLSIERLTPEYVDVPMAEVINLLLAAADGRPDER